MAHASSAILEELTNEDVRALRANVAVIPIGSTEPHGPALPYGTDIFQVEYVAYGGLTAPVRPMGSVDVWGLFANTADEFKQQL